MEKKALITGASSGLGREFALRLAAEGYQVTALARDEGRLAALLRDLGTQGRSLVADLSTAEGLAAAKAELLSQHYDLLINNAGLGLQGRFMDSDLGKQMAMLDVNVRALVELSHAFVGQALPGDALINVSSGLAFLPLPSMALYAASKALVTSFSESLWAEQRARGVYVAGLCPGITATDFYGRPGGPVLRAPRFMVQTVAQVVSTALKALRARRAPTVTSGWPNVLIQLSARMLSRRRVVSIMALGNPDPGLSMPA